MFRKHQQKTFVTLWILAINWVGEFEWICLKMKICDKNLFSDNVELSSKKF